MNIEVPGILQAFSLQPEGRKVLLCEVRRMGRLTLNQSQPDVKLMERALLIHDLCLAEVVPGEVLPKGLDEVIPELRKRVRANLPTLWDRLGVDSVA